MKNSFYKNIVQSSPVGYAYHEVLLSPDGTAEDFVILEANKTFESITELKLSRVKGQPFSKVSGLMAKDLEFLLSIFADTALNGHTRVFEYHSPQLQRWYNITAHCTRKSFLVTYLIDITSLKVFEEQLQKSEKRFISLMNNADSGFFIINLDGQLLDMNQTYCEMSGYSYSELCQMTVSDIEAAENPEQTELHIKKLLETGSEVFESRHKRKNGTLYDVEIRAAYEPSYQQILAFITDISSRKEAQVALLLAKDKAEASDQAKSRFLANITHEIRTPINAILGLSDIVLKRNLNKVNKQYIQKIHHAGENLLNMINDILDYSKIQSGKLLMENKTFNIQKLLVEIIQLFDHQVRAKGLKLSLHIEKDFPYFVAGDPLRLQQALMNLINNAIKFTPEGYVQVTAALSERANVKNLHLAVRDTGVGLQHEDLSYLFTAFSQADDSTRRKYGGTGLGLSISKNLLEMMGGNIFVASNLDKGVTFFLVFPFQSPAKLDAADEDQAASSLNPTWIDSQEQQNKLDVHILLVDDDRLNCEIGKEILKENGFSVFTAHSGEAAVEAVKAQDFQLILMDIKMPGMNGVEAAEAIKNLKPQVPVVALTGYALSETQKAFDEAIFHDYLAKPYEEDEFLELVAKHIFHVDTAEDSVVYVPSARSVDSMKNLDIDFGLERVNRKVPLYRKLLKQFYTDLTETIEFFQKTAMLSERQLVFDKLHSLKGLSGNMGAVKLYNLCRQVEENLKAQPEKKDAFAVIVDAINALLDDIDLYLKAYHSEEEAHEKFSALDRRKVLQAIGTLKQDLSDDRFIGDELLRKIKKQLRSLSVSIDTFDRMEQAISEFEYSIALAYLDEIRKTIV